LDILASCPPVSRPIKSAWSAFRSLVRQNWHRARGKQVVHFLHVGKTGGSAVKHALKPYRSASRYALVLHGHRSKLREVPAGDKVIFCLRDPISRFISGFYSRQRQGRPRNFVPWTASEKAAFGRFHTPNELARALSSADGAEREHATEAMRAIYHVSNRYSQWFESEAYLLSRAPDIFFVGFQETLDEDFELLKSELGLPASVKLPVDDIIAHKNPANLDKQLDRQAVENLNRWYADDFRFVEICRRFRASRSAKTGTD